MTSENNDKSANSVGCANCCNRIFKRFRKEKRPSMRNSFVIWNASERRSTEEQRISRTKSMQSQSSQSSFKSHSSQNKEEGDKDTESKKDSEVSSVKEKEEEILKDRESVKENEGEPLKDDDPGSEKESEVEKLKENDSGSGKETESQTSKHSEGDATKENEEEPDELKVLKEIDSGILKEVGEPVQSGDNTLANQFRPIPVFGVSKIDLAGSEEKRVKTFQFECKPCYVYSDEVEKSKNPCYVCKRFGEPTSDDSPKEIQEDKVRDSITQTDIPKVIEEVPKQQVGPDVGYEVERKSYLFYGSDNIVESRKNSWAYENCSLVRPPKRMRVKIVETEVFELQRVEGRAPTLVIERHLVPVISEESLEDTRNIEATTQTDSIRRL